MMALALRSGLRRSSNGFRITYIDAQLDAVPPPPEPTLVIVWATPGLSWVILSTLAMTSLVSSSASRIGQLEAGDQPALVHLGDEAGGDHGKRPARQTHQTEVDQQNQGAPAQRQADGPGVERGQSVEAAIEAAQEPAQNRIHRPHDEPPRQQADQQAGKGVKDDDGPVQPGRHMLSVSSGGRIVGSRGKA